MPADQTDNALSAYQLNYLGALLRDAPDLQALATSINNGPDEREGHTDLRQDLTTYIRQFRSREELEAAADKLAEEFGGWSTLFDDIDDRERYASMTAPPHVDSRARRIPGLTTLALVLSLSVFVGSLFFDQTAEGLTVRDDFIAPLIAGAFQLVFTSVSLHFPLWTVFMILGLGPLNGSRWSRFRRDFMSYEGGIFETTPLKHALAQHVWKISVSLGALQAMVMMSLFVQEEPGNIFPALVSFGVMMSATFILMAVYALAKLAGLFVTTDPLKEAYDAGHEAAAFGVTHHSDTLYPVNSEVAKAWRQGWNDGVQESMADIEDDK